MWFRTRILCLLAALAGWWCTGVARCQTPAPAGALSTEAAKQIDTRIETLMDQLGRTQHPISTAISPDGSYLAWTLMTSNGAELHLTRLDKNGAPEHGGPEQGVKDRIISPDTIGDKTNTHAGACTADSPVWSPDGKRLAFLSDCSQKAGETAWEATEQNEVFEWQVGKSTTKQLTQLTGAITSLDWSPDGKAIGFLFVNNATRRASALEAIKPWSGVIGEDGIEIQRVAAVGTTDGEFFYLTPTTLHAYEFSWAPDSRQITFVAANPPGENNWWIAKLYTISFFRPWDARDVTCPRTGCDFTKVVFDPNTTAGPLKGLQIAVPRYSPDGKRIAFIGGLMSDQGSIGGDIYTIPSTGGPLKHLETTGSAAWIEWLEQSSSMEDIGYTARWKGKTIYARSASRGSGVDITGFEVEASIGDGRELMSLSSARDGRVTYIQSSFDRAPEVYAGCLQGRTNPTPDCKPTQITHLNDNLKPTWGKSESINWTNDNFNIQGWLLYPANYDPTKKYPIITYIHGGPSNATTPSWPPVAYGAVPFSALGYFVFMPNPRGSYGQTEAFTQANVKDFGYGDLRDTLAGLDLIEKRFPVDKSREGITGWSYGGFMTMFAVTQTHRFHAAVAGAGISNWQSYYGENSIDQWMVPFFGATVYDDPAIYAKSSPINFIKNVKTPTLVVVGDRDGECPAPQSFEFWHALRGEGTKTQLVIYPNEGHAFRDPEHRRDVLERALRWFESEMPVKSTSVHDE